MNSKELVAILENALKDKNKSCAFYKDFFEQNSDHKVVNEISNSILAREQKHQEIIKTIIGAVDKKNGNNVDINRLSTKEVINMPAGLEGDINIFKDEDILLLDESFNDKYELNHIKVKHSKINFHSEIV